MKTDTNIVLGGLSDALFLKKIIQTQSCLTEADFNLDNFMQLVAEQIHQITPATGAVVELVEGEEMVYRAASGTTKKYLGLRLPIKNSISGLCVQTHTVLKSDDTETDARVNQEACRKVSARSLVVAPLFYQNNSVGVLKILSSQPHAFSDVDVQILQLMAGFVASGLAHQLEFEKNKALLLERTHMLTELQQAHTQLNYLAHFDYLTDLANRWTFTQQLAELMAKTKGTSTTSALLYLDIDHFKKINDTLGHDIGDALLRSFAQRLKRCIGKKDLAARFGGDEFVILINDVNAQNNAAAIAQTILTTMRSPFEFKNHTINITLSIGLSYYRGENISLDELIKQSDEALYHVKKSGRNAFKVFEKTVS